MQFHLFSRGEASYLEVLDGSVDFAGGARSAIRTRGVPAHSGNCLGFRLSLRPTSKQIDGVEDSGSHLAEAESVREATEVEPRGAFLFGLLRVRFP